MVITIQTAFPSLLIIQHRHNQSKTGDTHSAHTGKCVPCRLLNQMRLGKWRRRESLLTGSLITNNLLILRDRTFRETLRIGVKVVRRLYARIVTEDSSTA